MSCFVSGVGASSIAAAFNGAYVTLVDAFVTDELLDNLEANIGSKTNPTGTTG